MVRFLTVQEVIRKELNNHIKNLSNLKTLPPWVDKLNIPALSALIELMEHGVIAIGLFFPLIDTDDDQKLIDFRVHLNYLYGQLDD